MPERIEVPMKAIEAAAEALCEDLPGGAVIEGGTWIEDPLADQWGEWANSALAAALPAIYADLRERIEELPAFSDEQIEAEGGEMSMWFERDAVLRALDAAMKGESDA